MGYKEFKMAIIEEFLKESLHKIVISSETLKKDCSISFHTLEHIAGKSAKYCRVCKKDNIKKRKSIYKCKECSGTFQKDIILCVTSCFEKFHKEMKKYMERKKKFVPVKEEIKIEIE